MHGRTRLRDEPGFTLVEVLVVMIILAILAGIALSQVKPREASAQDADAKMAAASLYSQVSGCFAETEDFGQCETGDDRMADLRMAVGSGKGQVRADSKSPLEVTIAARSRSGTTFFIVKGGSRKTVRSCDRDYGGCRAGSW